MWSHYTQKLQFSVFLAFMCIYFSNVKVDASIVNDNFHAVANQQKGDVNLNDPYFARKFKCPLWFGMFPDVEDCSRYYMCVGGRASRMRCPPFLNFDKYTRRCLSKWIATCDKGEDDKYSTLPEQRTTPVKEKIFMCRNMFGTFPHPTDCSKYYTCYFFMPSLRTCPKEKLYDGGRKECRPESEVECESGNRQTTTMRIVSTPLYTESTTREIVTIPEESTPETTTTPTIAEEETTTEMPTGPPENDCDEDDLDCIITVTGQIPLWYKCPAKLDSFSHPSSRRLFIFCINWKPKVKKCGQDLIYSQKLKTCVSP
ncbi:chitin-binding domain protein cbd-1 [Parasteatoda tepidariorum]|uniref:chitin-binding domain protein cbd-1 n=1 Tax=Parasteatoda tepidariorum TaxID=114398 RepID=UPI001C720F7C|nr:uncharacterized protein LOC107452064 [Parasteatoda tepidariorum]